MNIVTADIGPEMIRSAVAILRSSRYELYVRELGTYDAKHFNAVYGSEPAGLSLWTRKLEVAYANKLRYFSKLAYINGLPCGFIYGWLQSDYQKAILSKLYVKTAFKDMGIGTKLVDDFLFWAGSVSTYVLVEHTNQNAVTFYERFGFKKTGRKYVSKGMKSIWLSNRYAKRYNSGIQDDNKQ